MVRAIVATVLLVGFIRLVSNWTHQRQPTAKRSHWGWPGCPPRPGRGQAAQLTCGWRNPVLRLLLNAARRGRRLGTRAPVLYTEEIRYGRCHPYRRVGRPLGSPATRRLRREDPRRHLRARYRPGGGGRAARELRIALNGEAGANQLLSLDTGSGTYLALARDMQRHPIAQTVTHVDFQIVRRDEIISADVSIVLTGEALEVHHGDGLVDQQMFTISINARPSDIPTSVELDITNLVIGEQLRISDLALPAGVTTDVDPETAVVIGQPPRVVTSRRAARVPTAPRVPRPPRPTPPATRAKRCAAYSGDPTRVTAADLLVVGLGNPGAEFEGTRHNAGADAVDLVAERTGATWGREGLRPGRPVSGAQVALAMPTTYMNDSGAAVRGLADSIRD